MSNEHILSLFRIGRKYERNKDKKQALEYYIKAADLGHTISLYFIGRLYERNKDIKQALEYYIKAANLGHTFSQWHLGNLFSNKDFLREYYEYALLFSKDDKEIEKKYYETLVDELSNTIENLKINIYFRFDNINFKRNKKITDNFSQAIHYYSLASENNHTISQYELGIIYKLYINDEKLALKYFGLAAENKHKYSIEFLKHLQKDSIKNCQKILDSDKRLYTDIRNYINLYF